jgi:hypothetical protein
MPAGRKATFFRGDLPMHERGLIPPIPGKQPWQMHPIPVSRYEAPPGTETVQIRCNRHFTLLTDGLGLSVVEKVAFTPGVWAIPKIWLRHWYLQRAGSTPIEESS